MSFEQEIGPLKDTLIIAAEIRRRRAEIQKMQAVGMVLHKQRRNHVDLRLSEITDKLDGLMGRWTEVSGSA
jgi:hypothetical protein